MIGCQGCESVPELRSYAPVNRFEISQGDSAEPLPLVDTQATASLTQGQTANTPGLAIHPEFSVAPQISEKDLDLVYDGPRNLSSLRFSGSAAIVDFRGMRKATNLGSPVRPIRDFDATLAFSAADSETGLGFDVGVVPRISVTKDGNFKQRRVGGEIRIGQNFDQRGERVDAKSWYLFAGADGEALVYEPYRDREFTESMALRDQVTVGDMQAGVSFTRGPGQLSISYIRREVEYNERGSGGNVKGQEDEDFAGISFTLRH
ncbi:lipid A-modifier LpxR family protein [Henriciella aquimarina]|uniref:lipid A-modifier LpxR family protein n=1 Tax=Henriciella aquimarina TaxID=545261 RepID=UPI001301C8C9|nr:lipid A-modifier LpxR family protein [Henriciella aquimarina]